MTPILRVKQEARLADTAQWQFRFNIQSESSNRLYTVAQHKKLRHWGCSCMGWRRYRKCKHLHALGIPNHEEPYEVNLINS